MTALEAVAVVCVEYVVAVAAAPDLDAVLVLPDAPGIKIRPVSRDLLSAVRGDPEPRAVVVVIAVFAGRPQPGDVGAAPDTGTPPIGRRGIIADYICWFRLWVSVTSRVLGSGS